MFVSALSPLDALALDTALSGAARAGDAAKVRQLLQAGEDPNVAGEREWALLHLAAMGGHTEAARALLERGADPNARGQYDLTPLHWAALGGHSGLCALLLGRGARVEARNLWGMTALHEAANEKTVEVLLDHGAKIDARDDLGLTPMFSSRSKEVGKALLARGADLHAKTREGHSLFDMIVITTVERSGLMLYSRRSMGRLRGERTQVTAWVRNVSPRAWAQVSLRAWSQAGSAAVAPARYERLEPGQLLSWTIELERKPELLDGIYPLNAAVVAEGKELGSFELLDVDTARAETPGDQGMIRLGKAALRPSASRLHYVIYLAVPLLALGAWWLARRR